jgi:hypothetical protein
VRFLTSFVFAVALGLGPAIVLPVHAAPETKASPKSPSRNVTGTVRSSSADTVVVAGRDKGRDSEWTFAVEPTTDIRKGSKAIIAADLKPGDGVLVRFVERNGKAHAEWIRVKDARKDAGKK